jgi:hypothetical protein
MMLGRTAPNASGKIQVRFDRIVSGRIVEIPGTCTREIVTVTTVTTRAVIGKMEAPIEVTGRMVKEGLIIQGTRDLSVNWLRMRMRN